MATKRAVTARNLKRLEKKGDIRGRAAQLMEALNGLPLAIRETLTKFGERLDMASKAISYAITDVEKLDFELRRQRAVQLRILLDKERGLTPVRLADELDEQFVQRYLDYEMGVRQEYDGVFYLVSGFIPSEEENEDEEEVMPPSLEKEA